MIIIFLFAAQYKVIHTIVDKETTLLWLCFALVLSVLLAANMIYALITLKHKKTISFWYAAISLVGYIAFIYFFTMYINDVLPFDIPRWIAHDRLLLYPFTFLMPAMAHCLTVCIVRVTQTQKKFSALINFGIAVLVPVVYYVCSLAARHIVSDSIMNMHFIVICTIAAILIFLFFLMRAVFLLVSNKSNWLRKYAFAYKIPIAFILPLVGLFVNNKKFGTLFGDFTNIWFYILTVVNALVLCLPNLDKKQYRIILFIVRSCTFAFSAYFFIVFLPYLPLSVLACIAFGAGFLMLSPLLLGIIHTAALMQDAAYLKTIFAQQSKDKQRKTVYLKIAALWCAGFIIIPCSLTGVYLHDRVVLHNALNYVYAPDYAKTYSLDAASLAYTLEVAEANRKNDSLWFYDPEHTPYLSDWFTRIVFDNLTIADSKLDMLHRVFFNTAYHGQRSGMDILSSEDIKISNTNVDSRFDENENVYISTVNFELTNYSTDVRQAGYECEFKLPAACWISDYYLYMPSSNGEGSVSEYKEVGILAEKKSALWVFNSNRLINRDPGIVYYQNGNTIAFKVFPFTENQIRRTGIEFTHLEPLTITIDEITINLGRNDSTRYDVPYHPDNAPIAYVPVAKKQTLPLIQRKPYFHFLLDASSNVLPVNTDDVLDTINKFLQDVNDADGKSSEDFTANAKVSIVNAYTATFNFDEDWETAYKTSSLSGGFFLDRAIKKALIENFTSEENIYPVFIVVTDKYDSAIMQGDYADIDFMFPEGSEFFILTSECKLTSNSLLTQQLKSESKVLETINAVPTPSVRVYNFDQGGVAYLPDTNEASIALTASSADSLIAPKHAMEGTRLNNAFALQYKWMQYQLHLGDKAWHEIVRQSFAAKLLSPETAFIVVENEAQKSVLLQKQAEALRGKKEFSIENDTVSMSEPPLIILLALLLIGIIGKQVRKNNYGALTKRGF